MPDREELRVALEEVTQLYNLARMIPNISDSMLTLLRGLVEKAVQAHEAVSLTPL